MGYPNSSRERSRLPSRRLPGFIRQPGCQNARSLQNDNEPNQETDDGFHSSSLDDKDTLSSSLTTQVRCNHQRHHDTIPLLDGYLLHRRTTSPVHITEYHTLHHHGTHSPEQGTLNIRQQKKGASIVGVKISLTSLPGQDTGCPKEKGVKKFSSRNHHTDPPPFGRPKLLYKKDKTYALSWR